MSSGRSENHWFSSANILQNKTISSLSRFRSNFQNVLFRPGPPSASVSASASVSSRSSQQSRCENLKYDERKTGERRDSCSCCASASASASSTSSRNSDGDSRPTAFRAPKRRLKRRRRRFDAERIKSFQQDLLFLSPFFIFLKLLQGEKISDQKLFSKKFPIRWWTAS